MDRHARPEPPGGTGSAASTTDTGPGGSGFGASDWSAADWGVATLLEQTARAVYVRRSPHDVHPGQWSALRYFARAGVGARTVAGLALYLGVTAAPASRAVSALVDRGFLARRPHPEDRRSSVFDLTDAGAAALADDPMGRLAAAVAALDPGEREALADTLARLHHALAGGGFGVSPPDPRPATPDAGSDA